MTKNINVTNESMEIIESVIAYFDNYNVTKHSDRYNYISRLDRRYGCESGRDGRNWADACKYLYTIA